MRKYSSLSGKFQSASHGIAGLSVWEVGSVFLEGIHFIIPTVGLAAPFGFRVDHKDLETAMEKPGPSLMHHHPQGPVDGPPEHASDRCRLRSVIGAVLACLERGAELGDGVGIRPMTFRRRRPK